jgi:hypothetical protein
MTLHTGHSRFIVNYVILDLHNHAHYRVSFLFKSSILPRLEIHDGVLELIDVTVSLLPPSTDFSSSSTAPLSKPNPVVTLQSLAFSLADTGSSDTNPGKKRAIRGFMTRSEAQMIATLISMVDHRRA